MKITTPAHLYTKEGGGGGRFFRTFRIKGWVANILGLSEEAKFALQNYEVG